MNSNKFSGNFLMAAAACALCCALGVSGQTVLNLDVGGATDTLNKALYGTFRKPVFL